MHFHAGPTIYFLKLIDTLIDQKSKEIASLKNLNYENSYFMHKTFDVGKQWNTFYLIIFIFTQQFPLGNHPFPFENCLSQGIRLSPLLISTWLKIVFTVLNQFSLNILNL